MKNQKQHNPKRFEGLQPSQFYQCKYCGIKYLGLDSFTAHMIKKHNASLDDFFE